jgi:nitroreductase
MEFAEVLFKRYSARVYQKKEIPEDKLNRILEAARIAPSAKNLQPWKFILVRDQNNKREVARLCKERYWIADASVIIVGVATNPDYRMGCGEPSSQIDLSIAFTQMMLAAVNEGLGSCWIGSFNSPALKKMLEIPDKYPIISLLVIGYPADAPVVKERKRIEEIVCYEKWSE